MGEMLYADANIMHCKPLKGKGESTDRLQILQRTFMPYLSPELLIKGNDYGWEKLRSVTYGILTYVTPLSISTRFIYTNSMAFLTCQHNNPTLTQHHHNTPPTSTSPNQTGN